MMKNFKRLFTFLLLGVMTASMAFSACGTPSADNGSSSTSDNEVTSSSDTEETSSADESSDSSSSLTQFVPSQEDFYEDRIKVYIKSEHSDVNKIWGIEDFPIKGNTIAEVIDDTWYGDFGTALWQQDVWLILSEHGREKVIDAATQIMNLEFVDFVTLRYTTGAAPCDIMETEDSFPNDRGYEAQWGLNGEKGINVEPV